MRKVRERSLQDFLSVEDDYALTVAGEISLIEPFGVLLSESRIAGKYARTLAVVATEESPAVVEFGSGIEAENLEALDKAREI